MWRERRNMGFLPEVREGDEAIEKKSNDARTEGTREKTIVRKKIRALLAAKR
jgi:hypothetical protein